MMIDRTAALLLLQLGDSAFPAGGFAFSWGLEGLAADGLMENADDLDEVIADQLNSRWKTMDRPLLARAFEAANELELAAVDRAAHAATPCAPMRDGSLRAGRALLGTAARLGYRLSAAYRKAAAGDARRGHLAVVQGTFFREAGLALEPAEMLSGWTLIVGLVGAATRLGLVGHVRAQRSLAAGREVLDAILASEPRAPTGICSFTPLVDIAVSRKRQRHVSMFAT